MGKAINWRRKTPDGGIGDEKFPSCTYNGLCGWRNFEGLHRENGGIDNRAAEDNGSILLGNVYREYVCQ